MQKRNIGKSMKSRIQKTLTPEHHEFLIHYISKDTTLVRLMKDNSGELYIAGGFPVCSLIGAAINDIDVFGKERSLLLEAACTYGLYSSNHAITPTKYTMSVNGKIGKVQFVVKDVYKDALECINNFDFSICQAAIWYSDGEWKTVCSPNFYSDLKNRRLRFVNQERINEAPMASLMRAAKYTERGFALLKNDKLALVERYLKNYHRKIEEQSKNSSTEMSE